MNVQDANRQWYQTQPGQPTQSEDPQTTTEEYTRAEQLFDAVLWEAEYGDDDKKPFYFALAEKLVGLVKK